jgi:dihydroorotate dehydrogenase (fumarate)
MNMKTNYLGLELKNPFVLGAGPLQGDMDKLKTMEDCGASAVVMHSLFEEEILRNIEGFHQDESHSEGFQEARTYLPNVEGYHLGPEQYLEAIQKTKSTVSIPVIASLNGATPGGWTRYASKMQEAGADAIELNIYNIPTDVNETSDSIESKEIEILKAVKDAVSIPVAVKISPFYSSFANFCQKLDQAGADGIVLFNRFYQPDIEVNKLEMTSNLTLSTSSELRLRLRWLSILSEKVNATLIATGGIHTVEDCIKAIMAGANGIQIVSALLQKGPEYLRNLVEETESWMKVHEYESVQQMCGSMSHKKAPNSAAIERANYLKMLDSWH